MRNEYRVPGARPASPVLAQPAASRGMAKPGCRLGEPQLELWRAPGPRGGSAWRRRRASPRRTACDGCVRPPFPVSSRPAVGLEERDREVAERRAREDRALAALAATGIPPGERLAVAPASRAPRATQARVPPASARARRPLMRRRAVRRGTADDHRVAPDGERTRRRDRGRPLDVERRYSPRRRPREASPHAAEPRAARRA